LRDNAQLYVGLAYIRELFIQNVFLKQVHEDRVTCQLVELPEQFLCLPAPALLKAAILQGLRVLCRLIAARQSVPAVVYQPSAVQGIINHLFRHSDKYRGVCF
jgi:hypothetical protein